jgi:hypothetical protein
VRFMPPTLADGIHSPEPTTAICGEIANAGRWGGVGFETVQMSRFRETMRGIRPSFPTETRQRVRGGSHHADGMSKRGSI